jgi:hypothetical protein
MIQFVVQWRGLKPGGVRLWNAISVSRPSKRPCMVDSKAPSTVKQSAHASGSPKSIASA